MAGLQTLSLLSSAKNLACPESQKVPDEPDEGAVKGGRTKVEPRKEGRKRGIERKRNTH